MSEQDDLFDLFNELESHDEKHIARENFIRAPFGWPGGKWHSLGNIIPKLGRGKILVDACGGSGIITINAPPSYNLKVFNDRHSGVTAFFRCLKDAEKLRAVCDWLSLSPHSREDFIWCRDSWSKCDGDVERAARWYYMVRTSFSQLGRNWGRSIKGPNQLAKKLSNSLEHVWEIHDRFINQEVQIENLDCIQCIKDYDSYDTDHYIDPDYIGTDPGIYEHRGYKTALYDSYPWDHIESWEVMVSTTPQVYNEQNHLADKRHHMGRDKTATEMLYIKEPHAG
jgi:site-specific DNA-adenine methylase